MNPIVTFNYTTWTALYPALAAVTPQATAQAFFDLAAATLLSNTGGGAGITDPAVLGALFNMLVAHLATLAQRDIAAGLAGGAVGRIDQASEGSVTVHMAAYEVGGGDWYAQTSPGAAYWQATRPYRMGFYASGPSAFTGVPLQPFLGHD